VKSCESCGKTFAAKQVIEGKMRSLYRRRFCLECSPYGVHNTSKVPPGNLNAVELIEYRLERRRAKSYRSQKKRRREKKAELLQASGGGCVTCGYSAAAAALDFHHRDASTKDFSISSFTGSWEQLVAESKKCDVLCANCHRVRHAADDANVECGAVTDQRRQIKTRAVAYMGGSCCGCGRHGLPAIFDFHHRDPADKEFGIGQDGIPRRWELVAAELAKCVMLCANCHREVHAGFRDIHEGLPGLAEAPAIYLAA
jgi:hypothetical protein